MTYSRHVGSCAGMLRGVERPDVVKLKLKLTDVQLKRGQRFREVGSAYQVFDEFGLVEKYPKKRIVEVITKEV